MDVENVFDFLIKDYNLSYKYQKFNNCYNGNWTVETYSFFNDVGCFSIYYLVQRNELNFYYSSQFSTKLDDLLEKEIYYRSIEPKIWDKHTKLSIFNCHINRPFFWWNSNKILTVFAEALKEYLAKGGDLFNIKNTGSCQKTNNYLVLYKANMTRVFRGCLIASISHAIMTNVYPDLSYEQSWDGKNYSMQNSEGLRGTITFDADYCVGAIRNETLDIIADSKFIQSITQNFPSKIVDLAYKETLQYLLAEKDGVAVPCVTSMFWADETMFHYQKENIDNMKKDLILFNKILLPEKAAISEWKEYYDMDLNAVHLLEYLYHEKVKSFTSKIVLNKEKQKLIPGNIINKECAESLKELNIFCE